MNETASVTVTRPSALPVRRARTKYVLPGWRPASEKVCEPGAATAVPVFESGSVKAWSVAYSSTTATVPVSSPRLVTFTVAVFDVNVGVPTVTAPAGAWRTTCGVNFTGSVHWS